MHLRTTEAAISAGIRRLATGEHLWTWGGSAATNTPGIRRLEFAVGEDTMAFAPEEVARIVRAMLPEGER